MPTTAINITAAWVKAADGPSSVLIPAISQMYYCVTGGTAPTIDASICPSLDRGEDLSCELIDGESLYVSASVPFQTSVTKDA